jgi:hypothetical protein
LEKALTYNHIRDVILSTKNKIEKVERDHRQTNYFSDSFYERRNMTSKVELGVRTFNMKWGRRRRKIHHH